MAHRRRKPPNSAAKRGQPPGTPTYVGEDRSAVVEVSVLDYSADHLQELDGASLAELKGCAGASSVTWVNLDGVHEVEQVRTICSAFGVHPLAIEDVLNPSSRVKLEDYGDSLFVVVKMIRLEGSLVVTEQVAAVLGKGWLLTFQEQPGDVFEPLRRRIRTATGRVRRMGPDYLLHGILDAVVDGTFAALDQLEVETAELEDSPPKDASETIRRVHALRGEISHLRRAVWPLRDVSAELVRSEGQLVGAPCLPFFRDLRDHVLQCADSADALRERLTGVLELELALTSHRMNEVMKTLTVVTSLFIPLSFVAGLYGMNFAHMPELQWDHGYAAVLALMASMVLGMLGWMRHKGWL
jgi:magnesium transporter